MNGFWAARSRASLQDVRVLARLMRSALPFLLAYAIFAHLIIVSFGATAMAAALSRHQDAVPGAAVAKPFEMMICLPGMMMAGEGKDAASAPETAPDGAPRWCCGLCLFQASALLELVSASAAEPDEPAASRIRWHFGNEVARNPSGIVPRARDPPAAPHRAA